MRYRLFYMSDTPLHTFLAAPSFLFFKIPLSPPQKPLSQVGLVEQTAF
nr:MAG TPA: hypothetical protein [Caudoviricetes sp.]